jgi:hypothetical protein
MATSDARFKRIQTPDEILRQPDLQPGAKVVGAPYQQSTAPNTVDRVVENQLMQLGEALKGFQPSLTRLTGAVAEQQHKQEFSEGQLWASKQESMEKANELIRSGQIPAGKSPWFMDGLMTRHMDMLAHQYDRDQLQAWQNSDARYSEDPGAFAKWQADYRTAWEKQNVLPLTQHRPNASVYIAEHFTPRASQTDKRMGGIHDNEKMQEIELKANQQVQIEMHGLLEDFYRDRGPGVVHDPKILANRMEVLHSQMRLMESGENGYLKFGFTGPRLNENIRAAFINFAKETGDASVLDAYEAYSHTHGHPAKAAKAKAELQAAREHIVSTNYQNILRQEKLDQLEAEGPPEKRIADYKARYDAQQSAVVREKLVREYQSAIYLAPRTQEGLAQREQYVAELMKLDGSVGIKVQQTLLQMEEHQKTLVDKRTFGLTELNIRRAMIADPMNPQLVDRVAQAYRDEHLDEPTMRGLLSSIETMRQHYVTANTPLKDPAYTHLEESVGKAVVKDFSKVGGEESLAMGQALTTFRLRAIAEMQAHPEIKTGAQLAAHMAPIAREIAEVYNVEMKQERERAEEKAKQREEVQKQVEENQRRLDAEAEMTPEQRAQQQQQIKAAEKTQKRLNAEDAKFEKEQKQKTAEHMKRLKEGTDAIEENAKKAAGSIEKMFEPKPAEASAPKAKDLPPIEDLAKQKASEQEPSPKDLAKRLTKEDRRDLTSALDRRFLPGVKEKPIDDVELRDTVRRIFKPHYSNLSALERAVDGFIEANKKSKRYAKKEQ